MHLSRFHPKRAWATALYGLAPVLLGAFVFSGCHRNPAPTAQHMDSVLSINAVPLSQLDLGASLLAAVDNARFAISRRDPVAAANDINEALSFARRLPERPSKLLLSEPRAIDRHRSSGVGPTPIPYAHLTDFGALVKLTSSQAELGNGNLEGADAELRAIRNGIPQSLIPTDLPLLRAAASLELARSAASQGRTSDLNTQLQSAQLALDGYGGPAHLAEARALADDIRDTLAQSGPKDRLFQYRVSVWLGRAVGLAGGDRWNPAPR